MNRAWQAFDLITYAVSLKHARGKLEDICWFLKGQPGNIDQHRYQINHEFAKAPYEHVPKARKHYHVPKANE